MITEVLLILPLYMIWFFIGWRFQFLIKIMADVENTLNDDDFFGDIVDTSKKHSGDIVDTSKKTQKKDLLV